MIIDLHCHSYFSDGLLSPEDLLARALQAGIRVLALTDHDTTAGLERLHKAALEQDIHLINGIELSVRWKKYDIHILGLNINIDNPQLIDLITRQKESRITRAIEIGERLSQCGIQDAYHKACEIAGHERIGRPHFAQLLINEGLVADMKAAFKRFLGARKSAYVPTPWITLYEAVAGIVQAGGQAVIAHPHKYKLTRAKLHELISEFKEAGGEGLEVVSGDMMTAEIQESVGICHRFELLASSGSDYHGDGISRMGLGRQKALPTNCTPIWQEWSIPLIKSGT